MPEDYSSHVVKQGAAVWNAWRERNPGNLTFAAPHWYDCPGRGGVQMKGRNRLDFSGMNLSSLHTQSLRRGAEPSRLYF